MSQHGEVVLKQSSVWTTKKRPPPSGALVWLYCRSLSLSSPYTAPFIIMVAVCRQSLGDGKEPHIQVNSQPERFLDYSLFIPVIPPAVVWSLREMCVWVRGARPNELRVSMLVVSRPGAVLHPTQKAHPHHQQHSIWFTLIPANNQASTANMEVFTVL